MKENNRKYLYSAAILYPGVNFELESDNIIKLHPIYYKLNIHQKINVKEMMMVSTKKEINKVGLFLTDDNIISFFNGLKCLWKLNNSYKLSFNIFIEKLIL